MVLKILLFSLCLQSTLALAQSQKGAVYQTEGEIAVKQLNTLIANLRGAEEDVESGDLPLLLLMQQKTQKTLESVKKYGLSHMESIREYQNMIIIFRFSSAYLERIRTPKIQSLLNEIVEIVAAIVEARGFGLPYITITLSTFTQIHQLLQELVATSQNRELETALRELTPLFGRVIARAERGDVPKTDLPTKELFGKLRKLSPLLHSLKSGERFNQVINIIALLEWYDGYARYSEPEE